MAGLLFSFLNWKCCGPFIPSIFTFCCQSLEFIILAGAAAASGRVRGIGEALGVQVSIFVA